MQHDRRGYPHAGTPGFDAAPFPANDRRLGRADMAASIAEGRPASAAFASHGLDVLMGVVTAADEGRRADIGVLPCPD